jgi:hypothetical protein
MRVGSRDGWPEKILASGRHRRKTFTGQDIGTTKFCQLFAVI